MALDFLKKKEEASRGSIPGPGQGTPTQAVLTMAQQGLTPNQVVEALQRQGYNQTQIYDALNQAAAKAHVEQGIPTPPPEEPTPVVRDAPPEPMSEYSNAGVEETVESVVEEKFKDVKKYVNSLKNALEDTNSQMLKIQQEISDLKNEMNNLHTAIVSKVSNYDKNLINVGVEIKAMEKVFQKLLPTLTDNVQELSKITKDMRK